MIRVNTRQCPARLSPRIIPHYLPKPLWETLGLEGESQSTAKTLLLFPTTKILLNKFTSSAIKSVIPSPSNTNFHLITLYTLHLKLQSFLLQSLLNVVLSMAKLNGQSPPKQTSPHLSMLFGNPCFSLCLFSSFSHSLFYFN